MTLAAAKLEGGKTVAGPYPRQVLRRTAGVHFRCVIATYPFNSSHFESKHLGNIMIILLVTQKVTNLDDLVWLEPKNKIKKI